MMYRAKCTYCHKDIEHFVDGTFLHDARDWYVEVSDESLAELIEKVNKLECDAQRALHNVYDYLWQTNHMA